MADEEPKNKQSVESEEESPSEPEPKHHAQDTEKRISKWHRFIAWYKADKKKSIPLTVIVLLLLLAAWPFSRYHAAGLVLKKDFTLQINDATTNTPVSGADVTLASAHDKTDAKGRATLQHVAVGQYTAVITKKYYNDRRISLVVPIMAQKNTPRIAFAARGRQVKIVLSNAINGDKLEGAEIKAAGTTATTDDKGIATIVVPTGVSSVKATLSAKGFNDVEGTVQVSDKEVKENDFKLTPAGKIYFLSKLSGKIDVVKTNLDGTGRQTVLAGTGLEDDQGTVLLANRSWKYLALLSKRDKGNPKLYLISTADDSLSVIDQGDITFNLVGWSDDNFVYEVTRNALTSWQSGRQAIKSFNAASKQSTLLDQTKASGTGMSDYTSEVYGATYGTDNPSIYLAGKNIIYDKTWEYSWTTDTNQLAAQKSNAIYSIAAVGSSQQTLKSWAAGSNYLYSLPYEADEIYYDSYSRADGQDAYFEYKNGKVTSTTDLRSTFSEYRRTRNFVSYLLSPSGSDTFWAESRDGKYTLFVGNTSGDNGKQIGTLSEYLTYGWYTDDYLLVSKNSSELYILPRDGIKKDSDALKITDYHKPAKTYPGYGGGYGGI